MNNQSKVSIDRAMEISLDEYIIESGLTFPESLKKEKDNKLNYYTKNLNNSTKCNDLREKFNKLQISSSYSRNYSSEYTNGSVQHRLNHPISNSNNNNNNIWNESISPVIKDMNLPLNGNLNNISTGKHKYKNRNKRNWRKQQQLLNMNGNNKVDEKQFKYEKIVDGKIQKRISPSQQRSAIPFQQQQYSFFKDSTTTIECTIPDLRNIDMSHNSSSLNLLTSQQSSVKNSLPDEFKTELMPMIAGKLLNMMFQGVNAQEDKQKYDLKLQKEIHSIQGKPMIYKCPGGEIISSDGPGVDCEVLPSTTGISLNQRFA